MNLRYRLVTTLTLIFNLSIAQVSFNNEASDLGIDVLCGNTVFGHGITFFDYDNDGWDDITIASAQGDPIRFLKNINGNFVNHNLNISENNWRNKQVNWVDIDNDGDNDLFITSDTSSNRLFENLGNMILQDITVASGLLTEVLVTYGASWGDYNNDGFLDAYLSNRDTSIPNVLYKNNGNNTFTIANIEAGLTPLETLSFCSAFFDYNNDGYQDLYIANDKVEYSNTLYENNGDGTFSDVSSISGTDISIDAMSVTISDYNNDGWMDIYVTNDVPGNVFLKNNGDGSFTNVAAQTDTTFNSVAWGAVFLDADNDADLDLYVSGEHDGTVSGYLSSAFYINNNDGTFNLNNSAIPNDFAISYSNAIGDTDNDGYPEIAVNNINHSNINLWKNNTNTSNNWLKVKLEGTQSNKNGIGSLIEISLEGESQYRYTLCGEGYLSQNSATEFFGIGTRTTIDYVNVKWLSGIEDIIYNVSVNQLLNITEGETLSTNESKLNSINLYPNPVLDNLYIESTNLINRILIHDIYGKVVLTHVPNQLFTILNTESLSHGVYFVDISGENTRKVIKIIKQ
jgi:hypothetical protein